MLYKFLNSFRSSKWRGCRFIIVGIDFVEHQLAEALLEKGANIIAFIDDEPWSHKTEMLGAPLRYPSEIEALAQRHLAQAVITFNQRAELLPVECIKQLKTLNIPVIQIGPTLSMDEQLNTISVVLDNHEQK